MNFNKLIEISKALFPNHVNYKLNHHVTFMVKKNRVVAIGVNHLKTNTKNLRYNYKNRRNENISDQVGTHSELSCVIDYGKKDCSDMTFVNIRIDRNGDVNNSKPCVGCMNLLRQVGFKKVYYSDGTGDFMKWTP